MSEKIDELVGERRAALGRKDGVADKWGLALSGGGIRSATFCFGLLGVFARNRLLERFDLLSTVSGGGYIGGMLGRLLQRARSTADTRAIFAAFGAPEPRWFCWWLRANGRYLVPRGTADRTFALAIFIRNLVAIHLELGALALTLGVALATIDVGVWAAIARWVTGERSIDLRLHHLPDLVHAGGEAPRVGDQGRLDRHREGFGGIGRLRLAQAPAHHVVDHGKHEAANLLIEDVVVVGHHRFIGLDEVQRIILRQRADRRLAGQGRPALRRAVFGRSIATRHLEVHRSALPARM